MTVVGSIAMQRAIQSMFYVGNRDMRYMMAVLVRSVDRPVQQNGADTCGALVQLERS